MFQVIGLRCSLDSVHVDRMHGKEECNGIHSIVSFELWYRIDRLRIMISAEEWLSRWWEPSVENGWLSGVR